MPYYESVFIARPDITAAQVETLTENLTTIAQENGGSVTKNEYWGLKSLAYRIKKNRRGHYSLLNLDAPPAAIKELERNMLLNEDVLRFITIRVDELDETPSIMMRNKGSREDRERRDDRERPSEQGHDNESAEATSVSDAPTSDEAASAGDKA